MLQKDILEESIEKNYTLDSLLKLYKDYFSCFQYETSVKLEQKLIDNNAQKNQKKELARVFADILLSEEKFLKLLTLIPSDVRKVFERITWSGGKYRPEDLDRDLELKIIISEPKVNINTAFLIICFEKITGLTASMEYKFYLPLEIRKIAKQYISKPDSYDIKIVSEEITSKYKFINNNRILKNIAVYNNYVSRENITYLKQEKPSATSLKNMKDFCEIKEFYDLQDKNLDTLKTELIIAFFKNISAKSNVNVSGLILLKEYVETFFTQDGFYVDYLINHIKGKAEVIKVDEYLERNRKVKLEAYNLFKGLPAEEWISIENFGLYVFYRDLYFDVLDVASNEGVMYFEELKRNSSSYSFTQKTQVKQDNYVEAILSPLLKGICFLLSSIGVLDIAYDDPQNLVYRQKNNDYLSPFDGLKYIRINDLGAYVFGLKNDYEFMTEEEEHEDDKIQVRLSEDFLLMKVVGKEKFKTVFVEKISQKISDDLYQVTDESFLGTCSSVEELKENIETFKSQITDNLPKNWSDFFRKILENTICFEKADDIKVYEIKNKTLYDHINNDSELSALVLKVETGLVAINDKNLPLFKEKVKKIGFFF